MPGLDGMDLARVIARFAERPQVVFVTAHDQHAVDAFAVDATDYVMKPVRADRLAEAVRRVVAAERAGRGRAAGGAGEPEDETIPVELAGVTRFITRSQIRYAQAQGDYARLHTATGSPPRPRPAQHPRGAVGRSGIRPDPPQHAGVARARQRGAHGARSVQSSCSATSSSR